MADPFVNFTFKWHGVDDVLARLKRTSRRLQTSIPRKAARRGMNLVRDSARAKLSVIDDPKTQQSQIWRNIITQESGRAGRRLGGIVMKVGVRGGASTRSSRRPFIAPGGRTQHWAHVELGTRKMAARPRFREALANNAGAVADTVAEEMRNELDKVGV